MTILKIQESRCEVKIKIIVFFSHNNFPVIVLISLPPELKKKKKIGGRQKGRAGMEEGRCSISVRTNQQQVESQIFY